MIREKEEEEKKKEEKGEGDTYLHEMRKGGGGVATRGTGVVAMGVLLKKGCHHEGVLSREMSSRVERREEGGVRVGR